MVNVIPPCSEGTDTVLAASRGQILRSACFQGGDKALYEKWPVQMGRAGTLNWG